MPFISLFSSSLCKLLFTPLSLGSSVGSSVASHRDKNIQVEAVVGLPEEKDEDEAEEAGAGEAPVQPRYI